MDSSLSIRHVVIVPDGNRRFAKKKRKLASWGHVAGAKAMENILRAALDLELPYLTIWGSSVSNIIERNASEVKVLLEIFERYFKRLGAQPELQKNDVRVRILGRWEELFPEKVKKPMRDLIEKTSKHSRRNLTFLMAYSGVDEILAAISNITEMKKENQKLSVSGELVKKNLWSAELPPVDLVIRTGGEPHWSAGLMMWDVAESQLAFTETLWPEFSAKEFKQIIKEKSEIEQRFGR